MTNTLEVYKCNVCGNVVKVVHVGVGELVCCDQPMELKQEKFEDEGMEKHVPVIERTGTGVIVTVGKTLHPMESEHYIEWIEIITEHRCYRKFLEPGQEPSAEFFIEAEHISARAYCNVHGLWKSALVSDSAGADQDMI
jgi:superoxide reductase